MSHEKRKFYNVALMLSEFETLLLPVRVYDEFKHHDERWFVHHDIALDFEEKRTFVVTNYRTGFNIGATRYSKTPAEAKQNAAIFLGTRGADETHRVVNRTRRRYGTANAVRA